ncbi:hypothetical protein [Streptomyces acidiscabies]|uniref:hypothetical protein n=1 Tax=Streptomyces acidiscabies TaxID=42234 RepID=UPI000289AC59|nr:hypothetical protein [Streptomyces acidiscabies]
METDSRSARLVSGTGRTAWSRAGGVLGEGAVDPAAAAAGGDRPGIAQHFEVVAEQIRRYRHMLLRVAHARQGVGELLQYRPAHRVGSHVQQRHRGRN